MRHRETTTGNLNANTHYLVTRNPDFLYQDISYTGEETHKFIDDTVTPNFRALKKCGDYLPLNPVVISTITTTRTPGTVDELINPTGPLTRSGQYWFEEGAMLEIYPAVNLVILQDMANAAAAQAAQAEFDLLTFMGEWAEAQRLMRQVVSLFNRRTLELAVRAVRETIQRVRRTRRWQDVYTTFAELWLTYRFGIMPLIYDANAVRKILMDLSKKREKLLRGDAMQGQDLTDSDSVTKSYAYGDYTVSETLTGNRVYRGVAFLNATLSSSRVGMNPLVSAYELTRYSFVLDYFINIGDWVQSLVPYLAGDYRGVGTSVKTEATHIQTISGVCVGAGRSGGFSGIETKRVLEVYERRYATVAFPGVNPRLNLPRVIDLVSLLVTGSSRVRSTLDAGANTIADLLRQT